MYTAASGSWTVLNGPYNVYIYVQVGLPAGCRWVGEMVGVSGVGVPYNVRYNVHIYVRIGVPHGVRVGGVSGTAPFKYKIMYKIKYK